MIDIQILDVIVGRCGTVQIQAVAHVDEIVRVYDRRTQHWPVVIAATGQWCHLWWGWFDCRRRRISTRVILMDLWGMHWRHCGRCRRRRRQCERCPFRSIVANAIQVDAQKHVRRQSLRRQIAQRDLWIRIECVVQIEWRFVRDFCWRTIYNREDGRWVWIDKFENLVENTYANHLYWGAMYHSRAPLPCPCVRLCWRLSPASAIWRVDSETKLEREPPLSRCAALILREKIHPGSACAETPALALAIEPNWMWFCRRKWENRFVKWVQVILLAGQVRLWR